jgi:DNA-binding LacI/PurR family transcriptional regulator
LAYLNDWVKRLAIATIKDVADLAGVSVATVSYVINKTKPVAPETAARVYKAIEALDYKPNAVARSLRTRNTFTLGVIVSDITNPFFAALVRGVEDFAREHGYSVLICNTSEDPDNERLYLDLLSRRRMDGVLLAPVGANHDLINQLVKKGMKIVFVDRFIANINVPAILSKNEEGAYSATSHLLSYGHQKIGIVLGLPHISTTQERLAGYRKALREHGIEPDPRFEIRGESRVSEAREACLQLLSQRDRPTAIFATNNFMTIGVMQAIHKLGLKCPDEISVVGFDDFEWTEAFSPPLTTVAQNPYKMGVVAARILMDWLSHDRRACFTCIRLETELRIRGSVAPPAK